MFKGSLVFTPNYGFPKPDRFLHRRTNSKKYDVSTEPPPLGPQDCLAEDCGTGRPTGLATENGAKRLVESAETGDFLGQLIFVPPGSAWKMTRRGPGPPS